MAWIKEKILIPKKLKPAQREVIADEVIDFIRDRSFAGLDKNNKKFKKYSDQYAKKKGVGVDDVDLVLEGEMLDELMLLSHKAGEITIGYEKGSPVNDKAEGNILGSYGRDPNPKKARDFLGISRKDLMDIVDTYTGESE
jgi:hypothetical protein